MKPEQYPYNLIPAGYGHYTYLIQFRGKEYRTTTNNTRATDDLRSEDGERDGRELRQLRGAKALRAEAIRTHGLNTRKAMKEPKLIQQARAAGLIAKPVTYRSHNQQLKRKGWYLIDPLTSFIQYTLEPVSYPPGRSYSRDKWMIHDHGSRIMYRPRLTAKDIDLTKRVKTYLT